MMVPAFQFLLLDAWANILNVNKTILDVGAGILIVDTFIPGGSTKVFDGGTNILDATPTFLLFLLTF